MKTEERQFVFVGTIVSTVKELKDEFGAPTYYANGLGQVMSMFEKGEISKVSGDNKVSVEWEIEIGDYKALIYDYKGWLYTDRPIDETEEFEFSVSINHPSIKPTLKEILADVDIEFEKVDGNTIEDAIKKEKKPFSEMTHIERVVLAHQNHKRLAKHNKHYPS